MGLKGSKLSSGVGAADFSSSSASDERRPRCGGSRVFLSSCLGNAAETRNRRHSHNIFCYKKKLDGKMDSSKRITPEHSEEISLVSSTIELEGCATTAASTSISDTSSRCLTTPNHFLSRLSFIPGNFSCRMKRASNIGSESFITPSSSGRINAIDEELRSRTTTIDGILSDDGAQQSISVRQLNEESQTGVHCFTEELKTLDLAQQNATTSSSDDSSQHAPGNSSVIFHGVQPMSESDVSGTRLEEGPVGAREPMDRSVRFSRTLSVGRLRDRVLRRSSIDITFCPFDRAREVTTDGNDGDVGSMNAMEVDVLDFERDSLMSSSRSYQPSRIPLSSYTLHNQDIEIPRSREARYNNLLEHRSNFVERRRRIRSQVRALQRMGSRFENFSGHERTCILSGQHRTGHCSCRLANREGGNDDTSARTSISRIVMLAEALFEVLDEIHQQSVVLSSRNSGSSFGSVPAPIDVVESLPLKTFGTSKKCQNDEVAQCYICLVEYEDGDSMRVLPCHHEFHRACVDKWLKEIHRVCPLCRGDICRFDSFVPPL